MLCQTPAGTRGGPLGRDEMKIDIEVLTTPREGGVVGSFAIDTHQRQYRPQETLHLAKWQPKDEPKHQSCLDRVIRELSLPASCAGRCRFPGVSRACGDPQCDVTSLDERRSYSAQLPTRYFVLYLG